MLIRWCHILYGILYKVIRLIGFFFKLQNSRLSENQLLELIDILELFELITAGSGPSIPPARVCHQQFTLVNVADIKKLLWIFGR